jgi:hypothetical protein
VTTFFQTALMGQKQFFRHILDYFGLFYIVDKMYCIFSITLELRNPNQSEKDSDHYNSNIAELVMANKYKECCLWSNISVTMCGETSHREISSLF